MKVGDVVVIDDSKGVHGFIINPTDPPAYLNYTIENPFSIKLMTESLLDISPLSDPNEDYEYLFGSSLVAENIKEILLKKYSDKATIKDYQYLVDLSHKILPSVEKEFLIPLQKQLRFNLLFKAGNLYAVQELWEEARDRYLLALSEGDPSYPNYVYLPYNLGNVYYQIKNYEDSIYYYEKALSLAPSDNQINNNIGNVYYRLGELEESKAQEFFKKQQYVEALKKSLDSLKEYEKSINYYKKADNKSDKDFILNLINGYLALEREHSKTIRVCDKAQKLYRDKNNQEREGKLENIFGMERILREKEQEIRIYSQKLLSEFIPQAFKRSLTPIDHAYVYNAKGNIYFERGDLFNAIQSYLESLELIKNKEKSQDQYLHATVKANLARAYSANDDFPNAEKYYYQAAKLDPSYEDQYCWFMAKHYWNLKNQEAANAYIERIKLSIQDRKQDYKLCKEADDAHRNGDYRKALPLYQKIFKMGKGYLPALVGLGATLVRVNDNFKKGIGKLIEVKEIKYDELSVETDLVLHDICNGAIEYYINKRIIDDKTWDLLSEQGKKILRDIAWMDFDPSRAIKLRRGDLILDLIQLEFHRVFTEKWIGWLKKKGIDPASVPFKEGNLADRTLTVGEIRYALSTLHVHSPTYKSLYEPPKLAAEFIIENMDSSSQQTLKNLWRSIKDNKLEDFRTDLIHKRAHSEKKLALKQFRKIALENQNSFLKLLVQISMKKGIFYKVL